MLRGYFDDSFSHDGAPVFTVAGYLAKKEVWLEWEPEWRAIIQDAGLTKFHMTDFEGRWGEFDGWTDAERVAVLRKLIDTFDSGFIWGVGMTTIRADFDEVVLPVLLPGRQQAYRDPYLWSMQGCMETIVRLVEPQLDRAEGVELVFDRRAKIAGKATKFYNTIVEGRGWGHIFKGISFGTTLDYIELQAADILAYEAAKHTLNTVVTSPPIPERKSFTRLVERRLVDLSYCDKESLRTGLWKLYTRLYGV